MPRGWQTWGNQSKSYSTASEASSFQSGIAALDVGYPVFWGSLPSVTSSSKGNSSSLARELSQISVGVLYLYIYIWGATLLQFANYDFNNQWQQRFFRPWQTHMTYIPIITKWNLMHILGPNAGKHLNFATKKKQFVGKNQQTFRDSPSHSPRFPPNLEAVSPLGVAWHQSPWASCTLVGHSPEIIL